MKRSLLFTVLVLLGTVLHAQPWMPQGNGPVKLQDVIANYAKHPVRGQDDDDQRVSGKVEKEGKNYLFDRWAWFWKEHLDSNGYMVSPVKTLTEWQQYQDKQRIKATAKTTSTVTPTWSFQGPDHSDGGYAGLGRINSIAFHPTDANTFYIGSAGGGTWKTTDNGVTWAAMYSNLPNMGVSDIKINAVNPNTVYVCTGDADGYDEYSIGVIVTHDGGATWQSTGLSWPPTNYYFARSLLISPVDTNELTLATNVGIYKSTDAGVTWTNVAAGNFEQILYNPSDNTIMYATNYTSGSSQILRSSDGGYTFTTVTSYSGVERINIAVCPSDPTVVKAIGADNNSGLAGIYSSSDNGLTYTTLFSNDATTCSNNILGYELGLPTTQCNGQGWYDLCIAVDPYNSSHVIVGGVNNYYSTDGGTTWNLVSQWYADLPGIATVHADKHCLAYNRLVPGSLYQGCDGGIYETLDPTSSMWSDLTNGLGVTEFYRNAVANGVPFCIGGAQDNGTKMVNAGVATDLTGGDGMQCQIDYTDPANSWYTSFPNGSIDRTFDGGATYIDISTAIPDTNSGDWVTPYIIHPSTNTTLLVGYDRLFISTDQGGTWNPASPVFDPGYNINSIVVPFTNSQYIYLATDDNAIHFSPDFGVTWTSIGTLYTGNISRLAVDPKNENLLWVTYNGYGTHKVTEYNRSTSTWSVHDGTLPDVPVNCIIFDSASRTKYIGTEVSVFYMDTTMTDWAPYNTNLPSVIINDLNINYSTNELWAATFGRGMWKTTKNEAPNSVANIAAVTPAAITVSPNPSHGSFVIHTTNKLLTGKKATVRLLGADGKTAWLQSGSFDAAGNLKVITTDLPKGTYICEVTNAGIAARNKVILY